MAAGYLALLRQTRGRRTYTYVFINALLHSGFYTWLGVYLHQWFDLDEFGIGLTLLGYGIPPCYSAQSSGDWPTVTVVPASSP